MPLRPTQLVRNGPNALSIQWSDGAWRHYTARSLRDGCPCATCREMRKDEPADDPLAVLSPADLQPLTIQAMDPVGSYAYHIRFSDGHHTGIYPLELLHELGREDQR